MSGKSISTTNSIMVLFALIITMSMPFIAYTLPITPVARIINDSKNSHEMEIEIAPYVFQEFRKQPQISTYISTSTTTPNIGPASQNIYFAKQSIESDESEPVVFDDEELPFPPSQSDSYRLSPYNKPEMKPKPSYKPYKVERPQLELSKLKPSSSQTNASNKNGTLYTERFLSNTVNSNECPQGHTYSKFLKRCMRKYSLINDSSVIG